jgi:DivIVA domain-containing protein
MHDSNDIRNRTFSFGAHGYNQDEVDRYLRELADRLESADVDWQDELRRLEHQSFGVVSLGYWRPDVDAYMGELNAWMNERAGTAESNGTAPAPVAEEEPETEPKAPGEHAAMQSGWAQGIVERLRRVTEASTAPTALAEVAEQPVPDVVSAVPLPLPQDPETDVQEEPADREADRVRLFRMAVALGVEDAVSMTVEELVAAIDRVQAGDDESEAAEASAKPAEDASAALARTKATLASFERMLADQVSQVTTATRLERESAARRAEDMLRDAERRAGEIVAAAEREGDALEERAQRYSERVRRMADREALRRAATVDEPEPGMAGEAETVAEPEPEMVAEPEPEPEPQPQPEPEMVAEPEPEIVAEPEPEMVAEPEPEDAPEDEPEMAAEPEVVEAEAGTADADADQADESLGGEGEPEQPAEAAHPEPASAWARLRRMLG